MNEKLYCVYILTNRFNTTLYTGVTNNLYRRVLQHKTKQGGSFSRKYNLSKLVYCEVTGDINAAILREKQLKAGPRKKVELIESINPNWDDLYDEI